MCMIDDADYDSSGFNHAEFRKAAKSHRCDECGRVIAKGERYRYAAGKFEGDMWWARQCEHCAAASNLLVRECGGFLYQGVEEDLREHISEPLPWRMQAARFVVAMSRGWECLRKPGLMPVPVVDMAKKSEAHA